MGIMSNMLFALWSVLKLIIIPLAVVLGFGVMLVGVWFAYYHYKGNRLQKGAHNKANRDNFLKNLFVNFPKRYTQDLYARNPEFFSHQGCIVFTGRQGYGKTIAMVEQAMMWQEEYPKCKVLDNLGYTNGDDTLFAWEQLIDYKNGIQGVIVMIDEMQNWFSSNQSKNFPPEMLEVVTQNRKNRRVIMGTAQCFNRLAKPLREQATEVRKCMTFLGCITFVHRVYPELNSSGDVEKWKHRGFYYFVHTDIVRDSYDTYKVIESLRSSGFQERAVVSDVINQTTTVIQTKK